MTEHAPLPEEIEDRILAIAASDTSTRGEQLRALAEQFPEYAAAIRDYADVAGIEQGARRIGPYRLIKELGAGGMGVVWLAEQREPVRRRVALKVIKVSKSHADHAELMKRLDRERDALAKMEHGNIARVHDAGSTEDGDPYVVMEYVPGVPIDRYCVDAKLGITDRLGLFQQICAGVQHAHQKGILHRDLKPQNILVTVEGGKARVKIIDFGLARATDPLADGEALLTQIGVPVGTPEYMSPEQAAGQDLDTTSDVYALGVILYELITGELPFPSAELRRAGALEMLRTIREDEPPKPSDRVSKHRQTRGATTEIDTNLRSWLNAVRGDLDWITMKALEKDRTRRYLTADALAGDVQRHLDLEPVSAGPPSAAYRLRKLARKYRVQFVAGGIAVAGLVIGLSAAFVAWRQELAQRQRGDAYLDGVRALAVVPMLERGQQDVQALLPAWPERREAFDAWLRDDGAQLRAATASIRPGEIVRNLTAIAGRGELPVDEQDFGNVVTRMLEGVEPRVQALGDLAQRSAEWARELDALMHAHEARWRDAITSIMRSNRYTSARMAVQTGLVPIGPDPQSGLWEFVHLRSSDLANLRLERDADGSYPLTEATGIVFVLVPPDTHWIGAQSRDPAEPNYDPDAAEGASASRVQLDAYFIAKYELSRAQWKRLALAPDPSGIGGEPFSDLHPVENVSWVDADGVMGAHGLTLPTFAQWEAACRGGSVTPWFCGDDPAALEGFANLADATAGSNPGTDEWAGGYEPWSDGFVLHAPVNADGFKANPFGLLHIHGNVQEWCLDRFENEWDGERLAGNGLRKPMRAKDDGLRCACGGSFWDRAGKAKATWRGQDATTFRRPTVGIRPARSVR